MTGRAGCARKHGTAGIAQLVERQLPKLITATQKLRKYAERNDPDPSTMVHGSPQLTWVSGDFGGDYSGCPVPPPDEWGTCAVLGSYNDPTMPRPTPLLLALALFASACVPSKVFLSTWEPATVDYQQGLPRLVSEALRVRDDELEALAAAGGRLIGYQNAEKGWARRVGSVGGTHFLPVERSTHTRIGCAPFFDAVLCRASEHTDWMRVAVIRVTAGHWHELPPHMIPPQSIIIPGVTATAWRTDCKVHNARGTVRCRNSWRVVTGAESVAAR